MTAERIDPRNGRRIVRALEVLEQGAATHGARPARSARAVARRHRASSGSRSRATSSSPRLDARVEAMWRDGLLDEVSRLRARGLERGVTARRAIGYAQALAQLSGELTEAEAIAADPAAHPALRPTAGVAGSSGTPMCGGSSRGASGSRRCSPVGGIRRLGGCRRPSPFTKGHGTGNDFVLVADPDGATRAQRRSDRGPLRPAVRHRRRRRAARGPLRRDRRRRRPPRQPAPSGSWTTGTPTAPRRRCAATASASTCTTCSRRASRSSTRAARC